nr:MAG TPA: hypothetical protein [Caudoviricetes sp.]
MKIKLNDYELELLSYNRQTNFIQGANRDCITFVFENGDYSVDELKRIFESSADDIVIADDDSEKHYFDYSILTDVEITKEVVEQETNDSPEQEVEVIKISVAQKTYTEKQEDARVEQLNSLSEVVADLLGGAL